MGALTWIVGGDFNTTPDEPRFAREKTIPALLRGRFQLGLARNSRFFSHHDAGRFPLSRSRFRPNLLSRRDADQGLGRKHFTAIERSSRGERHPESQVETLRCASDRTCNKRASHWRHASGASLPNPETSRDSESPPDRAHP